MPPKAEEADRPIPAGVTDPDAELSDRQIEMILEGELIPSPNAIHALAREVFRNRAIK